MHLTPPWAMLIAYMVLAILLAGHISAWPWLGLLLGVSYRSFTGFYSGRRDPGHESVQGPHRHRRRAARQLEPSVSAHP
ncbi:MAG: hypothetical protein NZM31_03485 [Gemmatales bacterium]|nr:hypothetical protein [Gemmatales bacterium]MDW8386061.1 hypothetical protein [Gemmatales bacterium]